MTALCNPRDTDDQSSFSSDKKRKIQYFDGMAMAEFHSLPLTAEDKKNSFQISFVDRLLEELSIIKGVEKFSPQINEMGNRLRSMEGNSVFLHGDLFYGNRFGSFHCCEPVTGVCDFATSGVGPKELDFLSKGGLSSEYQEYFLEGYCDGGGEEPKPKNIDILYDFFLLRQDIIQESHILEVDCTTISELKMF